MWESLLDFFRNTGLYELFTAGGWKYVVM